MYVTREESSLPQCSTRDYTIYFLVSIFILRILWMELTKDSFIPLSQGNFHSLDIWTTLRIISLKSFSIYNENNIFFNRQWIGWTLNGRHARIRARKKSKTSYSWKSPNPRFYVVMFDMRGMIYGTSLLEWWCLSLDDMSRSVFSTLNCKLLEKTVKQNVWWQYGAVVLLCNDVVMLRMLLSWGDWAEPADAGGSLQSSASTSTSAHWAPCVDCRYAWSRPADQRWGVWSSHKYPCSTSKFLFTQLSSMTLPPSVRGKSWWMDDGKMGGSTLMRWLLKLYQKFIHTVASLTTLIQLQTFLKWWDVNMLLGYSSNVWTAPY